MNKRKKDRLDELAQLTQHLQRVRHECLNASRRDDFRAVARLTCEAARLNRLILAVEGPQVPALDVLGDKLITGDTQPMEEEGLALAS